MPDSDQGMEDQRKNSNMDDSNTMTIEFLRARLLSERSISKSSRQRADELAYRVTELEEQLKIVSLQRQKAEKATAGVLAILENSGISEVSDAYDSSSDQKTSCGSEVGNNWKKEVENSVDSELRRNESLELSGSDNNFSPVSPTGLSWNGRRGTKQSLEKYKDPYLRRRSSFASSGTSSSINRVGKSCRQIRRGEQKYAVEEHKADPVKVIPQKNGVVTCLETGRKHEIFRGSETQEEQHLGEGSNSGCYEMEKLVANGDTYFNGHAEDKFMEKTLEDQAQLIGRFEEMEKAQREWEERFRDNNSSTPDSCDPGSRSDVTEDREEIKSQVQCHAGTVISDIQDPMLEDHACNGLSNTESNVFLPPHGDQKCRSAPASGSLAQDFSFSMSNVKYNQESLGNSHSAPSHGVTEKQSSQVDSSNTSNSSGPSGKQVSGSQNEHSALVPHETCSGFNEVLEALKQAKLSLYQKMRSFPLAENRSVGKAIEISRPANEVWDRVEIPVGCPGLFRVPTDYAVEASKANFLVTDSQPSFGNCNPTSGLGLVSSDQIISNSFMDSRSIFTADNFQPMGHQFLTKPSVDRTNSIEDRRFISQYSDTGSTISTTRRSFDINLATGVLSLGQNTYPAFSSYHDLMPQVPDSERISMFLQPRSAEISPNLDVGLSSSSQYAHPNYSSYPELISRTPAHEELSASRPSRSVKMPSASHLAFHNDHPRYMYR